MRIVVHGSKEALGREAGLEAARALGAAIDARGEANLVVATGASQFETLGELVQAEIDWSRVTAFHLDEYVGLGADHPASFRRYLRERFSEPIGSLRAFHEIDGDAADLQAECRRLGGLIAERPIDVACIGIGENGHLAFNDPPADFDTSEPYIVVELDEACRNQQVGEGWFDALEDAPKRAISMSIRQILAARNLIVACPDARKAEAVRLAVEGPLTPDCPASILRTRPSCSLHLDAPAASNLRYPWTATWNL